MFSSQKGTAILTAMIITLAIVGLTGSYLVTSFSYHSYQESEADKKIAEYRAIEASEKMRNFVYNNYRNPAGIGLSLKSWLASLRSGVNTLDLTVPAGHYLYRFDAGVPANSSGHDVAFPFDNNHGAWVTEVSPANSGTHWVEIEGYGQVEGSGIQGSNIRATVVQRISFGRANIFQNAILTKTVNCMGCHLQVRGDAGVLGFFRPGWGNEGVSGGNSGDGSTIEGNIYAASVATDSALKQPSQSVGPNNGYFISTNAQQNIEAFGGDYFDARRENQDTIAPSLIDPAGNFKINGMKIAGNLHTNSDDIGNRLPEDKDGNGERDFPIVDPVKAKNGATGEVSIAGTSGGKIYSVGPTETFTGAVSQEVSSIPKTADGSVVLVGTYDDPILLNGDVFIEGDVMVKGYVSGQGALYSGRNLYVIGDVQYKNPPPAYKNSSTPDDDAANDVVVGYDELRLAARNSVVIGDFTRDNDAETGYLPISQRQGQDFLTAQFGLGGSGLFRKGTGEELSYDGTKYYNDLSEEVDPTEVVTKSGDNYYNAALMPTRMDASGNTNFWISQQNVRSLIGTENLTYNSWRGNVSGTTTQKTNTLIENGFTSSQASSILSAGSTYDGGNYFVRKDGSTYKVIRDANLPYVKAVGKVDAFLYATKRIAGKVSGKNLVINGGLIGEKIGILAPGRKKEWWMGNSRYTTALNPDIVNTFNDEKFGKFTINYDYRLRNGGLGFELLQGEPGQRLFFQIKK